jgi:MSHA biogenesis protein MshO
MTMRLRSTGFTLIEMIMAITITGIVAAMVAVFIKAPIDSYFDSVRRAALTDVADTAVRRIARDVHLALPNSVRNPSDGSDQCFEFMPTKIGGRYRTVTDSAGTGNPLDFTLVDDSFDMLWLNGALPASSQMVAGDIVVVFNDGSASGNAYTGSNAIQVAGLTDNATTQTTAVSFVGTGTATPFNRKQLPSESPFYRFQVVPAAEHAVVYACTGGNLVRYRNTIAGAGGRARPADCTAMRTGAASLLAENVSACSLHYEPPGSATSPYSRNGILAISLRLTQSGESVRIYHQVHVDNTP